MSEMLRSHVFPGFTSNSYNNLKSFIIDFIHILLDFMSSDFLFTLVIIVIFILLSMFTPDLLLRYISCA